MNPKHPELNIDICKLFLMYLNEYELGYPSKRVNKHENKTGYKLIYMRYV